MKKLLLIILILMTCSYASGSSSNIGSSNDGRFTEGDNAVGANTYEVVSTGVHNYFDDFTRISEPMEGEPFFGQDSNYPGIEFSYQDNGDGTVSDLNTGLMLQHTPKLGDKMSWYDSIDYCDELTAGGYTD